MNTSWSLQNKKALVTGGTKGIGLAIVEEFVRLGAEVLLVARNSKQVSDTVQLLTQRGFLVSGLAGDVSEGAFRKELIQVVENKWGKLDILVNNVGTNVRKKFVEYTEEEYRQLFETNLFSLTEITRMAFPLLKKSGKASVINMASVAGSVGISERFGYSMTKGAVLSMTYSTALDYINHGIRCNSISPARVHTPFVDAYLKKNYPGKEMEVFDQLAKSQPIGRMGSPDEIANLALFLCTDEAAFITGCDYPIDGGFIKLVP